jgi:hypothetical protein
VSNRRDVWRDFMGRFEPSADPCDAVTRGFYVPRPGRSLAEQLAGRLELKPTASHLLVGGVGSGKTTQLLVARDRLEATADVDAAYVDVSLYIEPNRMDSLELLALVGWQLGRRLTDDEKTQETESALELLEEYLFLEGPLQPWENIDNFGKNVEVIRQAFRRRAHQVLLIDSLDRMSDVNQFAGLVEGAIAELRSRGIGVILVGPLTALYGIQRMTLDHFDRVWHLPSVDVKNDAEGLAFLLRVLQTRDTERLLTDAATERLVTFSGGVLRDVVALTQAAGEEAYVDGAEHVTVHHVHVVAEQFGRRHLFAIDSAQLEVLQRVRTRGTFVQTSEKDLALLATRRVLEYANGHSRFAVHPTIEPLLAQIAEAP